MKNEPVNIPILKQGTIEKHEVKEGERVNYSELKRVKSAAGQPVYKGNDLGLTETDLQDLIKALRIAQSRHEVLVHANGELMNPEECVRHLERASRYNELSQKLQNI